LRFHLRRFKAALHRAGDWFVSFGGRLRKTLLSRYVLVPVLCFISLWIYSRYITQLNVFFIRDRDRNEVTVHRTYTRDPELALAEAGIYIRGTDIVSLPKTQLSGGAADIHIFRTIEVSVTLDGMTIPVICLGGTVAEALEKAGYAVHPAPNVRDRINPSPETPVEEGMSITVTRYTILSEDDYQDIPFDTEEQYSPHINYGTSVIIADGQLGKRKLTYEVILEDGVEIFRGEAQVTPVTEPVTQVVVHGTGGSITLNDGTRVRYTKRLDVICTAYTTELWSWKTNAIGNIARKGTIAVDPKVIPLRTRVVVTSRNGTWHYGEAIAEDTGRLVKGNIIDLFFDTYQECVNFGRRSGYLYILAP
jgi:3D (Asp-Asp-Asp) domain-containing protein